MNLSVHPTDRLLRHIPCRWTTGTFQSHMDPVFLASQTRKCCHPMQKSFWRHHAHLPMSNQRSDNQHLLYQIILYYSKERVLCSLPEFRKSCHQFHCSSKVPHKSCL